MRASILALCSRAPRSAAWRIAIALVALGAAPSHSAARSALPTPAHADGLAHEELARAFRAAHGLEASAAEEIELADVLEKDYFLARLGLFELYVPPALLGEKARAEELRAVCAALFDAQAHWLRWLQPGPGPAGELREDAERLRDWARTWKPADLARAASSESHDLLTTLGASAELLAAAKRLGERLASDGGPLGLAREPMDVAPLRMALAPTRREFVEFLCFAGWWRPELRSIYWQPGIDGWVEFHVDDLHVFAMQYQAVGKDLTAWDAGTAVNARNPRRLEEQVAQLALNQLLSSYYDASLPGSLLGGLSLNLVIDQFGEVDTRVDGDLRSNETSERAMFVPGGASEGGVLPMDEASSRWRVDKGEDRFVRVLRIAQKAGAKAKEGSANRLARFELKDVQGTVEEIVSAPMFGAAASVPSVSAGLQGDLLEFLRAYKTAFLHWLRTESVPNPEKPKAGAATEAEQRFARFLIAMAQPENLDRFADVVEEVFGQPLSNAAADESCLEGRFLVWLSEQRGR